MWSFFSRDVVKDFGYEVVRPTALDPNVTFWKLHEGKKKATGEVVSIFTFEVSSSTQAFLDAAKVCVKRIKTLRHPSILTYIDSLETDKLVYLVTEKVDPISVYFAKSDCSDDQKNLAISWGLYQVATGLSFLNKDCNLSHNNLSFGSIFVDRAGEWKIFGLEYVVPSNEQLPQKLFPILKRYDPPEFENSKEHPWAYDSYVFGCLLWECFNGPMESASRMKSLDKVPQSLHRCHAELISPNPMSRLTAVNFLKKASKSKGFLKNKLVDTLLFLREIHLKETEEKVHFFNNLSPSLESFPVDICAYKILPEVVNAFEFGNAGSSILAPMFKLGKFLSDEEYQQKIVPCLIKMFSSKDRNTRLKLLQRMHEFIDHFTISIINSQIFPNVIQGFNDTSPVIREYTIKCMFYLAPKLNFSNLNEEMLKHFAKLQNKDEQGGIRTNTTVCLGKIASYLHPNTRQKVLIHAFLRALRDPFPPARTASILALSATEHFYSINDCATRILPALCHFTVDPDKGVRDQSFKAIDGFLQKLSKVSDDPALAEQMEKETQSMLPSLAAKSWTSWAVTSLYETMHMTRSSTAPVITSAAKVKVLQKGSKTPTGTKSTEAVSKETKKPQVKETPSEEKNSNMDGWDTEWTDEIINIDEKVEEKSTSMSLKVETKKSDREWNEDDWGSLDKPSEFQKIEENRIQTYFTKTNEEADDPFEALSSPKSSTTSDASSAKDTSGWDVESSEWNNWNDNEVTTRAVSPKSIERQQKLNEDRLAREAKRKQKQKERELARPKKLGIQKIS